MREKLLRLMKSEGLTSSRLAEILGTGASNISHIISGRSKPGYELLRKILLCFPRINPDWLLLDDEQMYRAEETTDAVLSATQQQAGSSDPQHDTEPPLSTEHDGLQLPFSNEGPKVAPAPQPQQQPQSQPLSPAVRRVIVIYDDKTFESFTPKQ